MGGFFSYFQKRQAKILLIGLDAAGKTTFLYRLKMGEVVTTIPTIGFNVELLQYKNVELTAWDVGGRDKLRPLIRHYYVGSDALIYIIDANDEERLDVAKEELHGHLNDVNLNDTTVIVVANKWDLIEVNQKERNLKYYYDYLDLKSFRQPIYIFKAVATTGEGLNEILDHLVDTMHSKESLNYPQTFNDSIQAQHNGHSTSETNSNVQTIWHYLKSILFEYNET